MKIIVVGCGSIGARHLRNLAALKVANLVAVDVNFQRLGDLKREIPSLKTYTNLDSALKKEKEIDAGFVCVPTSLHISIALKLAKAKINLFIEKPLSHNLNGIDKLQNLVKENRLITMVGMNYRFHPGLKIIKKMIDAGKIGKVYSIIGFGGHYLPYWHPDADYRKEYAAQKKLGGGVLLTSIHGLDYLRWLAGEPKWVFGHIGKVSNLEIDVDDIALAFWQTKKGIKVLMYTDFLQRTPQHRLDVIGEKGSIKWDFFENKVLVYNMKNKKWISNKYKFKINDMYVEGVKYYLICLEQKTNTKIDLEEGLKTLRLAVSVKNSSRFKKVSI